MKQSTHKVARDFSDAAKHYDTHAHIQRQVADDLLQWMTPQQKQQRYLDAGSGTGYATQANWQALDIAEGMCHTVQSAICADMQQLPLADSEFDGVYSSLAVQWLAHPLAFLQGAHRVTQPNGELFISTLGPETFQNLREAFVRAGLFVPILSFISQQEWEAALVDTGWKVQKCESSYLTNEHKNIINLFNYIKSLGARNKVSPYKTLRGKTWLNSLATHYPQQDNGSLSLDWQILKIHATK